MTPQEHYSAAEQEIENAKDFLIQGCYSVKAEHAERRAIAHALLAQCRPEIARLAQSRPTIEER